MSTTIKFDQAEIRDGWLCLKPCEYVDTVNAKAFCFGFKGVYDAELKKHYNKRSLNSNNYAWKLITEIANELRRSKEDVYLDLLKSYGQGGAVSVQEKFAENFKRTYKYHESLGKSFLKGCMWEHFRFLDRIQSVQQSGNEYLYRGNCGRGKKHGHRNAHA